MSHLKPNYRDYNDFLWNCYNVEKKRKIDYIKKIVVFIYNITQHGFALS